MKTALLLIAHGSRRPDANADALFFAQELANRGTYQAVGAAFLELAEPDIFQGAAQCLAQGAECIILLPFFLSPGRHGTEDLEKYRQELSIRYPEVQFFLAAPIGRHPLLVDILCQRATEAVTPAGSSSHADR
jgi:sirohydrochlorin ferrochelatase